MNFSFSSDWLASSALAGFSVLAGVATAAFWMLVGWGAMRAHERLAAAAEQTALTLTKQPKQP